MNYPKVVTYNLCTSEGKHIRQATKVIFRQGNEIEQIKFMEKMSKGEALKLAQKLLKR